MTQQIACTRSFHPFIRFNIAGGLEVVLLQARSVAGAERVADVIALDGGSNAVMPRHWKEAAWS